MSKFSPHSSNAQHTNNLSDGAKYLCLLNEENLNFPKPSEGCRDLSDYIEELARQSCIHPLLRDNLSLTSVENPLNTKLNELLIPLVQRLYPKRDFDAHPVVFLWSDSATCAYLKNSKPTVIVLGSKLFADDAELSIKNLSCLAGIICHECKHEELGDTLGSKHKNSPLEETLADLSDFQRLYDAGFAPDELIKFFTASEENRIKTGGRKSFGDVHLTDSLRARTGEMVYYDFKRKNNIDVIIESESDIALFDEIKTLAKDVQYVSSLQTALDDKHYNSASKAIKLNILCELFDDPLYDHYWTQFLIAEIEKIKFPKAAKASIGFVSALNTLHQKTIEYCFGNSGVENFTDYGKDFGDIFSGGLKISPVTYGSPILEALSKKINEAKYPASYFALHKQVDDTIDAFLKAKTPDDVVEGAQRLLLLEERTSQFDKGNELSGHEYVSFFFNLRLSNWPSISNTKVGEIVPWQQGYEALRDNPSIRPTILAAFERLDIHDARVVPFASTAKETLLIESQFPEKNRYIISFMCACFSKTFQLSIDENGVVDKIFDKDKKDNERLNSAIKLHPNLRRLPLSMKGLQLNNDNEDSDLFEDSLDFTNPLFTNWKRTRHISQSFNYQSELIKELEDYLDDPRIDRAKTISSFNKILSNVVFCEVEGAAAKSAPFYEFLTNDPKEIISPEARLITLLNQTTFYRMLRADVFVQNESDGEYSRFVDLGKDFNSNFRSEIHKLVPEYHESGASDWDSLASNIANLEKVLSSQFSLSEVLTIYTLSTLYWIDALELIQKEQYPTVSQFCGVLNGIPKRSIRSINIEDMTYNETSSISKGFYRISRTGFGEPIQWNNHISEALREWKTIEKGSFFEEEEAFSELQRLVTAVEYQDSYEEKLGNLLYIFGDCLQPDSEFIARIIDIISDTVFQLMNGKDDRTGEYYQKIIPIFEQILAVVPKSLHPQLMDSVLKKIEGQEEIVSYVKGILTKLTEEDFNKSNIVGLIANISNSIEDLPQQDRRDLLDFLLRKCDQNSIENFVSKPSCEKVVSRIRFNLGNVRREIEFDEYDKEVFPEQLRPFLDSNKKSEDEEIHYYLKRIHKDFWLAPFAGKILLTSQILIPIVCSLEEKQQAFEYVLKKTSSKKELDSRFALGLDCYFDSLSEGDRALLLTAMLVTKNPYERRQGGSLGTIAAKVLPAMGPVETKLAQTIEGYPGTPEEVARDMATTKYHANPPTVIEIFDTLNEHVPSHIKPYIKRIGKLIGSGSFYFAVEVELVDGQTGVLRLLRRNAKERANFSSRQLRIASKDGRLEELYGKDGVYVANSLLSQAEKLWGEEINPKLINPAQEALECFCNQYSVVVKGKAYSFLSRELLVLGEHGKCSTETYSFCTKVQGSPYISYKKNAHKTGVAVATCTRVLHAILNGETFPTDLMGGNANITEDGIGMFDPGGMYLHYDEKIHLPILRRVLSLFFSGTRTFSEVASVLRKEYPEVESSEGEYISALSKCFLALNDFFKEVPKDSLYNMGLAALKELSAERLSDLQVPVYVRPLLKVGSNIHLHKNT